MSEIIHHTESGERLSFYKLFNEKGYIIQIPIIQRDYAQGRDTNHDIRNDFLNALKEYLKEGKPNRDLDFIYGSLIKEKKNITSRFVPLDGQQRLTTLFLLHWYLAYKEDKVDNFRQVFAMPISEGQWSSKFTYETRTSASEFCNAIVSENIDINSIDVDDEDISTLSETIKNQHWYFLSWKNDPTIQGMLVMLDAIHDMFNNEDDEFYGLLTNSKNPIITFQFLKLEEFGLTDDLYIKMNARGKPLTSFENFKAKFEKQIKETDFNTGKYNLGSKGNERNVTLHEYFSHKIDTEWANFFWAYAKDELEKAKEQDRKEHVISYDDIIMNLFKTFATNFVAGKPNSDKQVRDLIKTNSKDLTYNQFKQYQCFDAVSVPNLIALLDCLQNQDKKARLFIPDFFYYDETILEEFLKDSFKTAVYAERIMFHAYAQYLIQWGNHGEGDYSDNLKKWMRIIHNLTENTAPYNNEKEYSNSIKGIDEIIKNSKHIHDYLLRGNLISGFDNDQIYEEQIKACLIEKDTGWDELVFEAEQHGYFKGQIGFLLRLSGVSAYFSDSRNCDWNEGQDANLKQIFSDYFQKAQAIFGNNGLKSSFSSKGDYVWEKALLATGDYLIWEGRNKSFLIGKDRDISWKRLLKGDKHETHQDIIKNVFDALDVSDIISSLESIISKSIVSGWRKAFIDTPKLFTYLGAKRYIRLDSPHGFVLFKGERMTGGHAELYSLKLYKDYLKGKPIEPFKESEYYQPTGADSDNMPCATLSGWGEKEYELDIIFHDNNYEIWFLNTGKIEISKEIAAILTDNKVEMVLSERYEYPGYVMKKDNDIGALDFINYLCEKLNNL